MKKLLLIIKNLVFLIFTLLLLVVFIQKLLIKDRLANIGGYSIVKVVTGSMEPTIRTNDFVLIKISDDININDIVMYKEDNYYIMHRLIEINEDNFITKGDANNTSEEITRDKVLGKLVYYNSTISFIINMLLNPITLVSLLIILFVVDLFGGKYKNEKESFIK